MNSIYIRFLIIICSFFTGMSALILQVIWNKKLSHLLGSDAFSQSMTVGVFLSGLSIGYFIWGQWAQKLTKQITAIYLYAFCELGIAFWCFSFVSIFNFVFNYHHSISLSSHNDFFAAMLLLFFPSFLMGGTIPLLLTGLTQNQTDLPRLHSVIYSSNTIGAGVGAILGGFFLLPYFGLSHTLHLIGTYNIFISLIVLVVTFKFKKHKTVQNNWITSDNKIEMIEDVNKLKLFNLSVFHLFTIAFFSGLWCAGLEIVFFRIASLSLGSSVFIYPFVVSLFILGLGFGALSCYNQSPSLSVLKKNLTCSFIFTFIVVCLFSYLNLWSNLINNFAHDANLDFGWTLSIQFIMYFLFLFPGLYYSGKLLPLIFTLLPKNKHNFSKMCGNLYFFNTLGSLIGSIGIGYFAYLWFSIYDILHLLLSMCLILLFYLSFREQKKVQSFFYILLIPILFITPNNRDVDVISLNDYRGELQFFEIPKHPAEVIFLKDDPLATISVLKHPANKLIIPPFSMDPFYYTIHLNGKNEGGTYSDSLTTTMLAALPYLFQENKPLRVAVIGLGTGVTVGLLSQLKNVAQIDVIEISQALIEAASLLYQQNYSPLTNLKVSIFKEDAFRFFQTKRKYDIIISEPSSIWNVGSETLYTKDFYSLIKNSLDDKGFFINWLPLYFNNHETVFRSLRTLFSEFNSAHSFLLAGGLDLGLLVSKENLHQVINIEHYKEKPINDIMNYFGFIDPKSIYLNEIFNWTASDFLKIDSTSEPTPGLEPDSISHVNSVLKSNLTFHVGASSGNAIYKKIHTLDNPQLTYLAYIERFKKSSYDFRRDHTILNAKKSDATPAFFSREKMLAFDSEFETKDIKYLNFCSTKQGKLKNPNCNFVIYLKQLYENTKQHPSLMDSKTLYSFGILENSNSTSKVQL